MKEQGARDRNECVCAHLGRDLECFRVIRVRIAHVQRLKLYFESTRRHLVLFETNSGGLIIGIPKDADARYARNRLLKTFQPFYDSISLEAHKTSYIYYT